MGHLAGWPRCPSETTGGQDAKSCDASRRDGQVPPGRTGRGEEQVAARRVERKAGGVSRMSLAEEEKRTYPGYLGDPGDPPRGTPRICFRESRSERPPPLVEWRGQSFPRSRLQKKKHIRRKWGRDRGALTYCGFRKTWWPSVGSHGMFGQCCMENCLTSDVS